MHRCGSHSSPQSHPALNPSSTLFTPFRRMYESINSKFDVSPASLDPILGASVIGGPFILASFLLTSSRRSFCLCRRVDVVRSGCLTGITTEKDSGSVFRARGYRPRSARVWCTLTGKSSEWKQLGCLRMILLLLCIMPLPLLLLLLLVLLVLLLVAANDSTLRDLSLDGDRRRTVGMTTPIAGIRSSLSESTGINSGEWVACAAAGIPSSSPLLDSGSGDGTDVMSEDPIEFGIDNGEDPGSLSIRRLLRSVNDRLDEVDPAGDGATTATLSVFGCSGDRLVSSVRRRLGDSFRAGSFCCWEVRGTVRSTSSEIAEKDLFWPAEGEHCRTKSESWKIANAISN